MHYIWKEIENYWSADNIFALGMLRAYSAITYLVFQFSTVFFTNMNAYKWNERATVTSTIFVFHNVWVLYLLSTQQLWINQTMT